MQQLLILLARGIVGWSLRWPRVAGRLLIKPHELSGDFDKGAWRTLLYAIGNDSLHGGSKAAGLFFCGDMDRGATSVR